MCVFFVCVSCVSLYVMQRLSGSHKALVEMQDDVAELLRSATRDYANTKVCVLVCAMICRSLLSRMSGFALVGA